MENSKRYVFDYWDKASCGEELFLHGNSKDTYLNQSQMRYRLEPYILDFANFGNYKNRKVVEIGVGLGADHQKFAEAGADLYGIDLTERAVEHTRKRFQDLGLKSKLQVADSEQLPYDNGYFDLVYSWGVIHHTPDTPRAVEEIYRVLKPGAEAKIMLYHKYSFVGYMLWLRYALMRLRPFTSLSQIYSNYLESPGTKAYSVKEVRELFSRFSIENIRIVLSHGDLLSEYAGQRHQGLFLSCARMLWPRRLIQAFFQNHGLFMMIRARKAY